jgi:diguanylate cyclase (GGDEF)-like protein/putative nucleotidyltransferase with HDIG domain
MIDFTLFAMGATAALIFEVTPFGVSLALLPVYLIYSTLRVPALERKSETDSKTGLFNAEYFQRIATTEIDRANRFERPLTVVMADMDLLRNINNTYGHLAGDEVLIGVAKILKQSVRDVDTVARFGGEEFAILMPETNAGDVYEQIDSLRKQIENTDFTVQTSVTPIKVTLSFGIASRYGASEDFKSLIHSADMALYNAKLKGRNRVLIYNPDGYEELFYPAFEEAWNKAGGLQDGGFEQDATQQAPLPDTPDRLSPEAQPVVSVTTPATATAYPRGKQAVRWVVPAFITGLAGMAAFLFGLTLHVQPEIDWLGLAVFTLVVGLAEWQAVDLYVRDSAVSTSAAPIMAGALLYGPIGSLVVSLTFAIAALVKHRSKTSRFIFNAANQMIAGLLCIGLMALTGKSFLEWPIAFQIAWSVIAAGIFYLSTTFLVTMAVHLDMGVPWQPFWREKFSWLWPYYLVMGLMASLLVDSYHTAGMLGVAVILLPLMLMRLSQKQYIERTRGMVSELKDKNLALEKSGLEIATLNDGLLNALAEIVDLRDPFVSGHSRQVAQYAVKIAMRLNLPAQQVELIRKAGLLHDIGKLGIPEEILRKPAKLTEEEYALVKTHTVLGAEILATSQALQNLAPIVRHHHEAFDGRGYPDGLRGDDIPLEARILAMADATEAMASDRPYRRALDMGSIQREIRTGAGTQFDPQVARAMLEILEEEGEVLLVNSARRAFIQLAQEQPYLVEHDVLIGRWQPAMD